MAVFTSSGSGNAGSAMYAVMTLDRSLTELLEWAGSASCDDGARRGEETERGRGSGDTSRKPLRRAEISGQGRQLRAQESPSTGRSIARLTVMKPWEIFVE